MNLRTPVVALASTILLASGLAAAAHAGGITGTGGDDTLRGTAGVDVIRAKGGADDIDARKGADLIYGGGGQDYIVDFDLGFTDTIYGEGGADIINTAGSVKAFGGPGHDNFNPSVRNGRVEIDCGSGFDRVYYFDKRPQVTKNCEVVKYAPIGRWAPGR